MVDPLVPEAYEAARAPPREGAAIWIDLTVSPEARAGVYGATLLVRDARSELVARPIALRVIDEVLPFAAAPAFVFYDAGELTRRMGNARAESGLRALFHAHHLGAVHRLYAETLSDPRALDLDRAAIDGQAYTRSRGYDGPGQAVGEGVLALGTYGSLGKPSADAREAAVKLARGIVGERGAGTTAAFVYAIDEQCDSDWPARWLELLRASYPLRGFRVGATCGADPSSQAADLVLQTARDLDPARAHLAEREGKWVWAYNGMRPSAGPMMLDVPATDLRANAWIAMRYGVPRWFYWESTFWFDDNRGGRGGDRGFDPFTEAETFHNRDGDRANGDGILVYPGTQVAPGMVSYGAQELFPSVRLKNLRRGIEDAGYIAVARRIDPERADAIVARVVPQALAWAGERPSWPQEAKGWLEARRALAEIVTSPAAASDHAAGAVVSESCAIAMSSIRVKSAPPSLALFLWGLVALVSRATGRKNRTLATNRKRDDAEPSTKPGHRLAAARGKEAPPSTKSGEVAKSERPTLPPAPVTKRASGMRPTRPSTPAPSATVDEVIADMTNDPRREKD